MIEIEILIEEDIPDQVNRVTTVDIEEVEAMIEVIVEEITEDLHKEENILDANAIDLLNLKNE